MGSGTHKLRRKIASHDRVPSVREEQFLTLHMHYNAGLIVITCIHLVRPFIFFTFFNNERGPWPAEGCQIESRPAVEGFEPAPFISKRLELIRLATAGEVRAEQ